MIKSKKQWTEQLTYNTDRFRINTNKSLWIKQTKGNMDKRKIKFKIEIKTTQGQDPK